jgi:hypothetical protein
MKTLIFGLSKSLDSLLNISVQLTKTKFLINDLQSINQNTNSDAIICAYLYKNT